MQKSSPDSFKIVKKITNPQNNWKLFDTFLNPRSMKFKLFYEIYVNYDFIAQFYAMEIFYIEFIEKCNNFFIDFLFPHSILLCRFFFSGFIWKSLLGKSWIGWFLICWWILALGLLPKLFINFPTHSTLHKKILNFSTFYKKLCRKSK
jgi:hypothetical protein